MATMPLSPPVQADTELLEQTPPGDAQGADAFSERCSRVRDAYLSAVDGGAKRDGADARPDEDS